MVSTIELLEILERAEVEETKAKAIIRVVEAKEGNMREEMSKILMSKADGALITQQIRTAFIAVTGINLTAILGAVYFLITYLNK